MGWKRRLDEAKRKHRPRLKVRALRACVETGGCFAAPQSIVSIVETYAHALGSN